MRQLARAHGHHQVARLLEPAAGEPPFDDDALPVECVTLAEHHEGAQSWQFLWRPNDVAVPFLLDLGTGRDPEPHEFTACGAWERLPKLLPTIGGGWFLPVMERMAEGYYPHFAEVVRRYRDHHDGASPHVTRFQVITPRIRCP
jgi:hypothetical protein